MNLEMIIGQVKFDANFDAGHDGVSDAAGTAIAAPVVSGTFVKVKASGAFIPGTGAEIGGKTLREGTVAYITRYCTARGYNAEVTQQYLANTAYFMDVATKLAEKYSTQYRTLIAGMLQKAMNPEPLA